MVPQWPADGPIIARAAVEKHKVACDFVMRLASSPEGLGPLAAASGAQLGNRRHAACSGHGATGETAAMLPAAVAL